MIGNLKADASRPFLRKNHKFKRGLKDKWVLAMYLLIMRFWMVNLLKLYVNKIGGNFLVSVEKFPVFEVSSSFKAIDKNVLKRWTDRNNQAIFKTATIVAASLGRSGRNVNLRKLWLTLALNVALRA